jgi:hypothetical protein
MLTRQQFNRGFWTFAVALAFLVAWFSSNLFYTLFWAVLGDLGVPVTEAKMTAYIAAHLVPFVLILLVGTGFYFFLRSHISAPVPATTPQQQASGTPEATADRFYDVPFQHLESLGWSSLIDVANKARAENADTPFGRSLSGVPIQEKTSIYAGKIGDYVQLYGCPPLWHAPSEPIKERGDQIRFRLNGGQMDSVDSNGKTLYRNIWLRTVDATRALASAAEMAREYRDPPSRTHDKPALTIKIKDGAAYDGDAAERDIFIFLADITGGDKSLTKCQVLLKNGQGHTFVLGRPFDLRPGEPKIVHLIRYKRTKDRQMNRAFVYVLRDSGELACCRFG